MLVPGVLVPGRKVTFAVDAVDRELLQARFGGWVWLLAGRLHR
jgi:hypothetical protein